MRVCVGPGRCNRCDFPFDVLLSGPAMTEPGHIIVLPFKVEHQGDTFWGTRCPDCGLGQAITDEEWVAELEKGLGRRESPLARHQW